MSLRTADVRLAKARLAEVRAEQHRNWEAIRATVVPVGSLPDQHDLADAAVEFVHERFMKVHRELLRARIEQGLDLFTEAKRRREKIAQVELLPSEHDIAEMERLAAAVCKEKGWNIAFGAGAQGDLWAELVRLVTRAVQHARGQMVEVLEGRTPETRPERVMARLGARSARRAKAGETVLDLFERYTADSAREGKSKDTLTTERKVIEHFAGFVGRNRDVSDLARADIREFRRVLRLVPHRWTARPELKGLSIAEAAARWEAKGGDGRSDRTVARELSAVSSFFGWLIENDYAEENPVKGFLPRVDKKKTKYLPYKQAQLQIVFTSPLFTRCDGLRGREHVVGDKEIRDWRYWLPLCALYSGARAGEIAQLHCVDVRQEQGVWGFDFNEGDADAAKTLKTEASHRFVPIHPALIGLGFLGYVDKIRAIGATRVFPEIEPGPRSDMSYMPSKFWQKYLRRLGLWERGLCLHSFRHTFADECRRRGVAKGVLQALLGHSDGSMTAHYGTLAEGNLEQRKAAIEALSYEGLHSLPGALAEIGIAA